MIRQLHLCFGLVVLGSALLLSGCFTFTPQVDSLADALERDLPGARLDRGHGVKFGRVSLGLARAIAGASLDSEDDPEAPAGLRLASGIKRVEFRHYELAGEVGEEWSPVRLELRQSPWLFRLLASFWPGRAVFFVVVAAVVAVKSVTENEQLVERLLCLYVYWRPTPVRGAQWVSIYSAE